MVYDSPATVLLWDDTETRTAEVGKGWLRVGACHAACDTFFGDGTGEDISVSVSSG